MQQMSDNVTVVQY